MDRERGGTLDHIILFAGLALVLATLFLALFYAPLVPTDVSTVVRSPADYTGGDLNVKGLVEGWDGSSGFNLTDVKAPEFKLRVTHGGGLPQGFGNGSAVVVTGELTDVSSLAFSASEARIDDEPSESAGWVAPYAQKIFYFHTPAAWASYLAFGVVLVASIAYLRTGSGKWDALARGSAEIGVVFCTMAIVTGPIWAKPEWGIFWRWEDTKLLTTFVLWMIFLGYVVLRGAVPDEKGARLGAVFGIAGFASVPISFVSSRIWQSLHPNPVGSPGGMSPEAGITLLMGVIAFTLVYIWIVRKRLALQRLAEDMEELKEGKGGAE